MPNGLAEYRCFGTDLPITTYGRRRSAYAVHVGELIDPPIGFAHRGARAHAIENTLEAFTLAARLGATGMESDVWLTADGIAVLDHDGIVKSGLRKRSISEVDRDKLPAHIPTLAEYYAAVGTEFPLSLDVKDPAAYDAVIATATSAGGAACANLWLCDPVWTRLADVRRRHPDIKLVDSTRFKRISDAPERHAAQLSEAGITGINMHYTDWTGGLVALFHRFALTAFGWDAQHPRMVQALIHMGIDAVYSDHVDMMSEQLAKASAIAHQE